MRTLLSATLLLVAVSGCAKDQPASAPAAVEQATPADHPSTQTPTEHASAEKFKLIHVDALQQLLDAKGSKVVVLDANDDDFRAQNGIIPGAKLLTSSSKFDVEKELPADKATPLVFYCSNSH